MAAHYFFHFLSAVPPRRSGSTQKQARDKGNPPPGLRLPCPSVIARINGVRTVCDIPLWDIIVASYSMRALPLEFLRHRGQERQGCVVRFCRSLNRLKIDVLSLTIAQLVKLYALPPYTPPLPPPRPSPPPYPLAPCWSPGARRERLAVFPTLSFASVVVGQASPFFIRQYNHELL